MSIYHCHISNVSRAKKGNSCATCSYITGLKIYSERTRDTFDYGKKQRVVSVATHLPKHAPIEYADPAKLCNAIENYETNENARPAKKIEVALPREFDLKKQKEVVSAYCQLLTKQGYACVSAIHRDKTNNNPHAHILVVNRAINSKGEFVQAKSRKEYVLSLIHI